MPVRGRGSGDLSQELRVPVVPPAVRTRNGIALPFVELRHVDGAGGVLPRDGVSRGELQVRGPWVTQGYLGFPDMVPATDTDGWVCQNLEHPAQTGRSCKHKYK